MKNVTATRSNRTQIRPVVRVQARRSLRALALLALPAVLSSTALGQGGTTVLNCPAIGLGGDNAAFRGVRFQVGQSFTAVEVHIDGSSAGVYTFDVELRRSTGYVAAIEATAMVNANLAGTASSAPYQAVRIDFPAPVVVSGGMETFTLKAVGITGPGAMYWEVAGIGNFPCPDAEVTDENNVANPTMRTSACGLTVLDGSGSGTVGTNYCTANPNSTGAAAAISASGSPAIAINNVILSVADMPTNSFGFFLTSQSQALVLNPGGSQGNLCLGGAIGRYVGPGQIQNSGSGSDIDLAIDLLTHPTSTGFVAAQPGETWNFTAWFRDTMGGAATSNFSDGLEITFL